MEETEVKPTYEIKLAKRINATTIVDLLNNVTLKLHEKNINQWEYPWDLKEIERDIENRNTYIVTTSGSLILGTFSIRYLETKTWIPIIEPNNLYLYRIAVLSEYQGNNIGLKIMNYACQSARASKQILYLDCWAGNEKLKNFYTKAGFVFCGDFQEEDYEISVFKY